MDQSPVFELDEVTRTESKRDQQQQHRQKVPPDLHFRDEHPAVVVVEVAPHK